MVIQCVRVLFGVILVLAATAAASAQSERGSITGVVQDSTRAVLPGVAVKVVNTDTNAATTVFSADSGSYNVASLSPGVYRIEASIVGFQSAKVEGIRVTAGATARIDVTLTPGALTESVSVVATNTAVQTEDAKITTNVSNEQIDKLPLVVGGAMRSVFDLVQVIAEAKGSGGNVVLGGGQGGAFGATLDGISVNTNRNAEVVETVGHVPTGHRDARIVGAGAVDNG